MLCPGGVLMSRKSRLMLGSALVMPLIETNLCVGAGRCVRPARIDTVLPIVDVHAALARWMHRVCADLAGCYENPV
jgi:hypothetical protein